MSDETRLVTFPLSVVEKARKEHQLEYVNRREYDYTFAAFSVIPYCLTHWAEHGIDLSSDFAFHLWNQHADRRDDRAQPGEMGRAHKLMLDALRAVYDVAAFAEIAGIQVTYQRSHDMAGRDLLLVLPGVGPTWVQMTVNVSGRDYLGLKQGRRLRRGSGSLPTYVLEANRHDLDTSRQPWVPCTDWYGLMAAELMAYVVDARTPANVFPTSSLGNSEQRDLNERPEVGPVSAEQWFGFWWGESSRGAN